MATVFHNTYPTFLCQVYIIEDYQYSHHIFYTQQSLDRTVGVQLFMDFKRGTERMLNWERIVSCEACSVSKVSWPVTFVFIKHFVFR
jgi:hypothetical protein